MSTPPIINITPNTGRLLTEDGGFINIADLLDPNSTTKASVQLQDTFGRSASISSGGEQLVAGLIDQISINFQYGISTRNIKFGGTVSGSGSVSSQGSTAKLSIGTTAGSAQIESVDAIRYVAGHEVRGVISFIFAEPEEGVNQYAGFLNGSDGWCVGYQGLQFGLWFIEGGNFNFIPQSSFNIDVLDGTGPSGYNADPTKAQLYRLSYTWHGFMALRLEIVAPDLERFTPVHIQEFINVATTTHLENPNLPLAAKIVRASGTGLAKNMLTGSWRAGVADTNRESSPADRWFAWTKLDVAIANSPTKTNVFTIRNKATYQGKTNHIAVELAVVTFDSTLNKTVAVYGTKGATVTGGTAYTSVDATNSVIEVSEGGSVNGGSRGPATVIKSGGERRTDVRGTGIIIYPGETFTFEVDPGGNVTGAFSISARWVERH